MRTGMLGGILVLAAVGSTLANAQTWEEPRDECDVTFEKQPEVIAYDEDYAVVSSVVFISPNQRTVSSGDVSLELRRCGRGEGHCFPFATAPLFLEQGWAPSASSWVHDGFEYLQLPPTAFGVDRRRILQPVLVFGSNGRRKDSLKSTYFLDSEGNVHGYLNVAGAMDASSPPISIWSSAGYWAVGGPARRGCFRQGSTP